MTTEQLLDIAIAKWLGWTAVHNLNEQVGGYWAKTPDGENLYDRSAGLPDVAILRGCPNFTGDLNAIASAEAKLSDDEHWKFRAALWDATDPVDDRLGMLHNRRYASATALQRATALAKALNLSIEP